MFWADDLLANVSGEQTINDSKTPSGRVHVGALRGVLIHDAVYRVLKEKGVPCRYLYGIDDYDPVDEIPAGMKDIYADHLGKPLFQAPAPPGSKAGDMAEHFISEFLDVFAELDVEPTIYRMRDVYQSGRFNEAIDRILSNAHVVREEYLRVSNSVRPDDWIPFQAICEKCGKIGTTQVFAYDGKEVRYRCRPDMVTWAQGCGYEGSVSPFDGRGKLPWKLEWVAKWFEFPVTIEGAGKDHSTAGGSRDVSSAILRRIFDRQPPLNVPYEFFLVGGAKMSSSKGLGASARGMADFLPPEILRFLMIRPKPHKPVNFEPTEANITKLFNEYDRFQQKWAAGEADAENTRIMELSDPWQYKGYLENLQVLTTLAQMDHLDLWAEVAKRKGAALTEEEKKHIQRRLEAAKYWLEHYALDSERIQIQKVLPNGVADLSAAQRWFLNQLAGELNEADWGEESIQAALFTVARATPLPAGKAFQAVYAAFLGRESGPKAGSLLSYLQPDFVLGRLHEVPGDLKAFVDEVALDEAAFEAWLAKQKKKPDWQSVQAWDHGSCYLAFVQNDKPFRLLLAGEASAWQVYFQQKQGFDLKIL